MLRPFATASRLTPIHHVASGTVARRLRIDVHDIDNDNDYNDNA